MNFYVQKIKKSYLKIHFFMFIIHWQPIRMVQCVMSYKNSGVKWDRWCGGKYDCDWLTM
jgi:hypothetical protein